MALNRCAAHVTFISSSSSPALSPSSSATVHCQRPCPVPAGGRWQQAAAVPSGPASWQQAAVPAGRRSSPLHRRRQQSSLVAARTARGHSTAWMGGRGGLRGGSRVRVSQPQGGGGEGWRGRRPAGASALAVGPGSVMFTSTLTTDIPFKENAEVPFSRYLEDRNRVFQTLFPDRQRSRKLNDDDWRITMLPISFFLVEVRPVVDMRLLVSDAQPPTLVGAPPRRRVGGKAAAPLRHLRLQSLAVELRGLSYQLREADFQLEVDGVMYAEPRADGVVCLRGAMRLEVSLAVPPALSLTPRPLIESVGNALLSGLLESMKQTVNTRVLKDYEVFAWDVLLKEKRAQVSQLQRQQISRVKQVGSNT